MNIKRTKIVCTLGPASNTPEVIEEMMRAGMDVVRLNFSHGTHEEKAELIKIVRKVADALHKPVAIIADLQGPKLRLGEIDGQVEISKGDIIRLSYTPRPDVLPLQFDLAPFLEKGHRIFLNDGLVELEVTDIHDGIITATAHNSGWVSSHKGVNIPDTHIKGYTFTEKDQKDAQFAIDHKVEYLALSFVQTPDDVTPVRTLIDKHSSPIKIVVKIEKKEALKYLDEILDLSDAVMVARGDLAIETSAAEVPIQQQRIIRIARQQQKPVIVATQMLESMINNPRPTRAEASDVAHAVFYQVDAVMLSAESAVGKYPVQAVKVMTDIINSVENTPEFKQYIKIQWEKLSNDNLAFNAIASSAASLAYKIHSPIIGAATSSGRIAHLMSSFRPSAAVVAITHDEVTRRQLALLWGVYSVVVEPTKTSDEFWHEISTAIRKLDMVRDGSSAVLVAGTIVGVSGATDTIRVITL